VLDWQATAAGSPLYDVASLLGGSLTVEERRAHETDILKEYAHGLRSRGVSITDQTLHTAYRRATFASMVVTAVHVGSASPPDERSRAQLREVVARVFTAADDHDALDALSR
jgi:Protein of unknown function (DUF1679)